MPSHYARVTAIATSALAVIGVTWTVSTTEFSTPLHSSLNADIVDVPVDALAVSAKMDDPVSSVSVPQYAKALHGRRVRMAGIMYPTFDAIGLTTYYFIPETRLRPYGIFASAASAPLHSLITVTTTNGHTEEYQERPFVIEGVFEIDIQTEDDRTYCLYRIRDAKITETNHRLQNTTALVMVIC